MKTLWAILALILCSGCDNPEFWSLLEQEAQRRYESADRPPVLVIQPGDMFMQHLTPELDPMGEPEQVQSLEDVLPQRVQMFELRGACFQEQGFDPGGQFTAFWDGNWQQFERGENPIWQIQLNFDEYRALLRGDCVYEVVGIEGPPEDHVHWTSILPQFATSLDEDFDPVEHYLQLGGWRATIRWEHQVQVLDSEPFFLPAQEGEQAPRKAWNRLTQ